MRGWIYENDCDDTVRYVLGTKGENPLICFGVNPSTARPEQLDNTLRSVERLSEYNGFDSWIMFNLYPQRATNPNDIHQCVDKDIHLKNLHHIGAILQKHQQPTIWAAWGTLIEKRHFLTGCLKEIYTLTKTNNCNWVSIGNTSKKGHPHHPLYLKKTEQPTAFHIDDYLKAIHQQ